MAYETLALGLTLTLPTSGTRNWGATIKSTTWTKISNHDHTGGGNGLMIGTSALVNLSVSSGKLAANIALKQYASVLAPVGTTQTVDWNNGNSQQLDLNSASGDVTLTLSNPQTGGRYMLEVTQGATIRDLVWPANCKWQGGVKPALSTDTAAGDVIKVELYFNGTNYLGDWNLAYS